MLFNAKKTLVLKPNVGQRGEGFKLAREVASAKAMEPFRGVEKSPGDKVKTDAEIDAELADAVPDDFQHPKVTAVLASDAVGDLRELLYVSNAASAVLLDDDRHRLQHNPVGAIIPVT